jgi:hypothetical protein
MPRRGSAYAGWNEIASNLGGPGVQGSNKKILETLEVSNEVLDHIPEEFKTIVFARSMKIHSFEEAQGITSIKEVSEKVCVLHRYKRVPQTSQKATLTAASGGGQLLLETRPPTSAGDRGQHLSTPHADG